MITTNEMSARLYITQNYEQSYSLHQMRDDQPDDHLGTVSYSSDQKVWKARAGTDDYKQFGRVLSALRWIVIKSDLHIDDTVMLQLLDSIVTCGVKDVHEEKAKYVVVPTYPFDFVKVDTEDTDLWKIRYRQTGFDHHGEPHDESMQLGLLGYGYDDEGDESWFTVSLGQDKVYGDAVKVLQHLLVGHTDLAWRLALTLWDIFNEMNNQGFVQLDRKG